MGDLGINTDVGSGDVTLTLEYKKCFYKIKVKKSDNREGYYLYVETR